MTINQEGDVYLFNTLDGGEINEVDGVIEMNGGLETTVYLALFGGNEHDSGQTQDDRKQYWGNALEIDENNKLRSRTQHIIAGLPATSSNLNKVEEAAELDTAYLVSIGAADSVRAEASIPDLNKLKLILYVEVEGEVHTFKYIENWSVR